MAATPKKERKANKSDALKFNKNISNMAPSAKKAAGPAKFTASDVKKYKAAGGPSKVSEKEGLAMRSKKRNSAK